MGNFWDNHAERIDKHFTKWVGDETHPAKLAIFDIIEQLGVDSIVDVGAGPCSLNLIAQARGWPGAYFPIDFTNYFLAQTKEQGINDYLYHDVTTPWPVPDDSSGIVVIRHILEHTKNWSFVVEQSCRVSSQYVLVSLFDDTDVGKTRIIKKRAGTFDNVISVEHLNAIMSACSFCNLRDYQAGAGDRILLYGFEASRELPTHHD